MLRSNSGDLVCETAFSFASCSRPFGVLNPSVGLGSAAPTFSLQQLGWESLLVAFEGVFSADFGVETYWDRKRPDFRSASYRCVRAHQCLIFNNSTAPNAIIRPAFVLNSLWIQLTLFSLAISSFPTGVFVQTLSIFADICKVWRVLRADISSK